MKIIALIFAFILFCVGIEIIWSIIEAFKFGKIIITIIIIVAVISIIGFVIEFFQNRKD